MAKKYSFNELVKILEKTCTNSKGYLGVEIDNMDDVDTEDEKIDLLFYRVSREILYLQFSGQDHTEEYWESELEEAPFRSMHYVNLHIERLRKFIIKYEGENSTNLI